MVAEDRAEWLRMRCELWPECSAERHALEMREWASQPEGAANGRFTPVRTGFSENSPSGPAVWYEGACGSHLKR